MKLSVKVNMGILVGLLMLLCGLVVAVASSGDSSITVVQGSEPRSLDPTICVGKSCIIVQNAVMDTLVYLTRENKMIPWLATSWESLNSLTWRIHLREGVNFHNGEPCDAMAVAFTIETYNASKGEGRGYFQYVDHTEIVDDYTIDIITSQQNVVVPQTLAQLFLVPPKYYAEVGSVEFSQHPIGTGPFVFDRWIGGVSIVLRRNADYWNGAPEIDEVVFKNAAEASTRVAMLLTGEADIIANLPPEFTDQVTASDRTRVEWVPSIRKIFIEFYRGELPFDDIRVRKAANYAVDKDALINFVLGGFAEKRKGVIVPGWVGYNPDELVAYEYDPDKARELLIEAGYPNGLTVDFWYPIGRYLKDKTVAEAIQGMLEQVGFRCEMHGMDISSLCQKVHTMTLSGMHFFSLSPLICDTDNSWRAHFWSQGLNQYAWDETTDRLLEEGVMTFDISERARIYQELEQHIVNEMVPWIFLYDQAHIYGVNNRVEWKARPDELIDLRHVTIAD